MNKLVKKGSKCDISQIEYIPTVEDLQTIFQTVQPCNEVPVDEIKCAVQAQPISRGFTKLTQSGLYVSGLPTENAQTIAHITLRKFRDGDNDIWLYEGKVKA